MPPEGTPIGNQSWVDSAGVISEYQGRLFARYGIPVSGRLATSPAGYQSAVELAARRRQGAGADRRSRQTGGIKVADADRGRAARPRILGLDIRGHVVHKLWIEQASEIARYYLSLTFDRGAKKPSSCSRRRAGRHRAGRGRAPRRSSSSTSTRSGFQPYQARSSSTGRRLDPGEADRRHRQAPVRRLHRPTRCLRGPPLIVTPAGRCARSTEVHGRQRAHKHPTSPRCDPEAVPIEERAARAKSVTSS